jgi:hypothetical protein
LDPTTNGWWTRRGHFKANGSQLMLVSWLCCL